MCDGITLGSAGYSPQKASYDNNYSTEVKTSAFQNVGYNQNTTGSVSAVNNSSYGGGQNQYSSNTQVR